eukprot:515144-Amphidinium_carterae.2
MELDGERNALQHSDGECGHPQSVQICFGDPSMDIWHKSLVDNGGFHSMSRLAKRICIMVMQSQHTKVLWGGARQPLFPLFSPAGGHPWSGLVTSLLFLGLLCQALVSASTQ